MQLKAHKLSYHIVKTYTPSFKKNLSRKAIDKCKPDLQKIRTVYYSNVLQGTINRFFLSFTKRDTSYNTVENVLV